MKMDPKSMTTSETKIMDFSMIKPEVENSKTTHDLDGQASEFGDVLSTLFNGAESIEENQSEPGLLLKLNGDSINPENLTFSETGEPSGETDNQKSIEEFGFMGLPGIAKTIGKQEEQLKPQQWMKHPKSVEGQMIDAMTSQSNPQVTGDSKVFGAQLKTEIMSTNLNGKSLQADDAAVPSSNPQESLEWKGVGEQLKAGFMPTDPSGKSSQAENVQVPPSNPPESADLKGFGEQLKAEFLPTDLNDKSMQSKSATVPVKAEVAGHSMAKDANEESIVPPAPAALANKSSGNVLAVGLNAQGVVQMKPALDAKTLKTQDMETVEEGAETGDAQRISADGVLKIGSADHQTTGEETKLNLDSSKMEGSIENVNRRPFSQMVAETTKNGAAITPPEVRVTVIRDMITSMVSMARNGETRLTVSLRPEELGRVHVELISDKDTVKARILVETEKTHGMLQDSLADLKAALKQEGYNVQSLDVQLDERASKQSGREAFKGFHQTSENEPSLVGDEDSETPERTRYFGYNSMEIVA